MFALPLTVPFDAALTVQWRVRHPSRSTTVEYFTINARRDRRTLGDFGRFTSKAAAQEAVEVARLDLRTRRVTAFQRFEHLVEAIYTPTLSDPKLADAYDAAQAAQGSDKRCHRRR